MLTLATPARPWGHSRGRGAEFKAGETFPPPVSPLGWGAQRGVSAEGGVQGSRWPQGKESWLTSCCHLFPERPRSLQAPYESSAQEGTGQLSLGGFEGGYPKKKARSRQAGAWKAASPHFSHPLTSRE